MNAAQENAVVEHALDATASAESASLALQTLQLRLAIDPAARYAFVVACIAFLNSLRAQNPGGFNPLSKSFWIEAALGLAVGLLERYRDRHPLHGAEATT